MRNRQILALAVLVVSVAACTKPPAANSGAAAPTPASVSADAAAAAVPVTLLNAYMSNAVNDDGSPGAPGTSFAANDRILVGAVLRGQAANAVVKAELSRVDGAVLGSTEASIPVQTSSVATMDLGKAAPSPLAAGKYKVLVSVNGAPSWELLFDVHE